MATMTPIDSTDARVPAAPVDDRPRHWVYRHRVTTRVWHWVNVVTLTIMLMSGLMIFNAHPRLYWGSYGANFDHAWLQIGPTAAGGHIVIGPVDIPTGGLLGRWKDGHGTQQTWAFPYWATIPSDYSLAGARRWHLSFAWVLVFASLFYWIAGSINRHLLRDVMPTLAELRASNILRDVKDHARLRFPTGEAAMKYNILQKLAYGSVVFVMLPLMILTGITMAPTFDANFGWLLPVFGGRQSARSIHFLCAWGLVGFTLVHLAMVLLAGPIHEVRSIVTGWFRIPPAKGKGA